MKPASTTLAVITLLIVSFGGMATGQSPAPPQPHADPNQPPPGFDFGAVFGQMYDGIFSYLAEPETAKKLARFQKGYYEALIEEGFSKEEALKIICSTGIPSVGRSEQAIANDTEQTDAENRSTAAFREVTPGFRGL